jgi:hypothetical protein
MYSAKIRKIRRCAKLISDELLPKARFTTHLGGERTLFPKISTLLGGDVEGIAYLCSQYEYQKTIYHDTSRWHLPVGNGI